MFLQIRHLTVLLVCSGIAYGEILTTAGQVRALDRDVAAEGLPVRLEGVVTYLAGGEGSSFMVQDATAGIFIQVDATGSTGGKPDWPEGLRKLERGMRVVVTGETQSGQIAPDISLRSLEVIGRSPLPEPEKITLEQFRTGAYDSQFVEMEAVVRFARLSSKYAAYADIDLIQSSGRFTAYLQNPPLDFDYDSLIDAKVRVRGVGIGHFNDRGQLMEPFLRIAGIGDIEVIVPGTEDPFAAPLMEIRKLYHFSPDGHRIKRQRVIGTVTSREPGQYFYLQEGGRGIRVNTRLETPLRIGDRVEVSGFPEMRGSFAVLSEAVYRVLPGGEKIEPVPIEADRIFDQRRNSNQTREYADIDGLLVSIEGKVVGDDHDDSRFFLTTDELTVPVTLIDGKGIGKELLAGSRLRVSGICLVDIRYGYPDYTYPHPVGFEILAQSADDITVISSPPWWTPRRLWMVVGIISAILALALAWSVILRRKVAQRSAELALEIESKHNARLEFDAVLRERKRLAADIHDTLEQSLTGVAFQVEAMTVWEERKQPSAASLPRLRQSLAGVREDLRRTIWNIRSNILEDGDLTAALEKVIELAESGTDAKIHLEVSGEKHTVSDFIASQTLMIAQEAITNARKHASPDHIRLHLSYLGETLELVVEDDGSGFSENPPESGTGDHYGMRGMKERAARMGADLSWKSGKLGTRIFLKTPVA